MVIGVSTPVLLGSAVLALGAALTCVQQSVVIPADGARSDGDVSSLSIGCETLPSKVDVTTSFDFSGPCGGKPRMNSSETLIFHFIAMPWRITPKGQSGCVGGDEQLSITLDYGRSEEEGTYKPEIERAKAGRGEDEIDTLLKGEKLAASKG